jgi:hypothetical protein
LIRELDSLEPSEAKATPSPTPSPTPAVEGLDDPAWATENSPEQKENFNSNVPPEFRRVELFIGGTVPPREMIDTSAPVYDENGLSPEPEPEHAPAPNTTPSPTPLVNTWENQIDHGGNSNSSRRSSNTSERGSISVMVCPVTGMRATSNCPYSEARRFKPGTEPREFCTLHR